MSNIFDFGETIAARMDAFRGRTTGFDYVRIFLAASVILAHSRAISLGLTHHVTATGLQAVAEPPFRQPLLWAIVPSFFALSGFLVAGSMVRSRTTLEFVMLRVLRIVPALFVETLLAAFVLGPLVTSYPLSSYFAGRELWQYPLNIIGDIHYRLPGVFLSNPWPKTVNAQLGTIPAELLCYLSLVVLSVFGLTRKNHAIPFLTTLAIFGALIAMILSPAQSMFMPSTWVAGAAGVTVLTLVLAFLAGVTFYVYKDRIPLNIVLFLACCAASYALLWNGKLQYLSVVPLTYCTVYVGLADIPKTIITATGDYSYGIYLYGFPVQQTVAYLLPHYRTPVFNFVISLIVAGAFAAASWYLVESQILHRRKVIIAAVQGWVDQIATTALALPRRIYPG